LSDENQWGDFGTVNKLIVQNMCCKRAFLRGAFMVAGSVTNPEKGYHLEIAVLSAKLAEQLKEEMSAFEIDAKIVERKKYQVVYIKEGAQIVDFLNVIGAHMALMEFENVRIVIINIHHGIIGKPCHVCRILYNGKCSKSKEIHL
jgi:cell division protein WhiA